MSRCRYTRFTHHVHTAPSPYGRRVVIPRSAGCNAIAQQVVTCCGTKTTTGQTMVVDVKVRRRSMQLHIRTELFFQRFHRID
jgi:hypothetical protein